MKLLALFLTLIFPLSATPPLDLDHLYERDYFEYSLPRAVLESYLNGKSFDYNEYYTKEELERLYDDIQEINASVLLGGPFREKEAVITAGAPGAGKTTLQKQDLKKALSEGRRYAYVCPDDVCLRSMKRSYGAEDLSTLEAKLAAYNKWRPASNGAFHLIMGHLIRQNKSIYVGTTSTGAATPNFFKFLKSRGYKIRLLHVTTPDDVRWASVMEMDLPHTTEEDVRQKGLLLPQRIVDAYLTYADVIEFYFRSGVHEDAHLAATWEGGVLKVHSLELLAKVKELHNRGALLVGRPDLLWEETVEPADSPRRL